MTLTGKSRPALPIVLFLLLAGCNTGPHLPSYGVVPDFRLTDQSGREFASNQNLLGRVWVANFIFTTCTGPCPRMTAQFRTLRDQAQNSDDFRLVSFTVDPERDTPAALAEYGRRYGADPDKWYFLTGSPEALQKLSKDTFHLGFVDGSLTHSTRFVLVDRKARIRGFYDSSDPERLQALKADIDRMLRETA